MAFSNQEAERQGEQWIIQVTKDLIAQESTNGLQLQQNDDIENHFEKESWSVGSFW